jgi:TonB family protein
VRIAILAFVVACQHTTPSLRPPAPHAEPAAEPAPDAGSDSGDQTALNAKRWVYAAYFNRLKRTVYTEWNPGGVWKAMPSVDRPDVDTVTTVVKVVLLPDGSVSNVSVTQPCGVPAIDAEGVRAMTKAGPFRNPPPALVKDGVITFPFSFYFEVKAAQRPVTQGPP